MTYCMAKPSEYLIIIGSGIEDIKLDKKRWIFPFQASRTFDITPMNYAFDVQAMSFEKLPFTLPAVFTIGPRDEPDSLKRYAKLVADEDMSGSHVTELIKGVVERETRVLAASMSMEEVFKGTKEFKQQVFNQVQLQLNQFGLRIYNVNIKQLVDIEGHDYFSYLGQKTQQEAANQAKVDVAEAKYKGDKGAKERQGLTLRHAAKVEVDAETKMFTKNRTSEARQQLSKFDAETNVFKIKREVEVAEANANLAMKKSQWLQQSKIADIESSRTAAIRDAELSKAPEQKKALVETERLGGEALAKATVDYEVNVQVTNAEVYRLQKDADVAFYSRQKQAEGLQKEADAFLYRLQKEADAYLYGKQKEAEGISLMAHSQASYVGAMLKSSDRITSLPDGVNLALWLREGHILSGAAHLTEEDFATAELQSAITFGLGEIPQFVKTKVESHLTADHVFPGAILGEGFPSRVLSWRTSPKKSQKLLSSLHDSQYQVTRNLLFQGIRAWSFIIPQLLAGFGRYISLKNEFGPGFYTTDDLDTAITYAQRNGAIFVFDWSDSGGGDLAVRTLSDLEWKQVTKGWLCLGRNKPPPPRIDEDLVIGPITKNYTQIQGCMEPVPSIVKQFVGIKEKAFLAFATRLVAIIYLE